MSDDLERLLARARNFDVEANRRLFRIFIERLRSGETVDVRLADYVADVLERDIPKLKHPPHRPTKSPGTFAARWMQAALLNRQYQHRKANSERSRDILMDLSHRYGKSPRHIQRLIAKWRLATLP